MRAPPSPRYCPACGAPDETPAARACSYCRGPLVPVGQADPARAVRCTGCGAAGGVGASYCGECGAPLAMASSGAFLACPACEHGGGALESQGLAPAPGRPRGLILHACRGCGGVWLPRASFEELVRAAVPEAALAVADGATVVRPATVQRREVSAAEGVARYRRCCECGQLMQRRNFGRVSGVIVDVCGLHGTFFDPGELEDVLRFVRSGGLVLAERAASEEDAWEARQRQSGAEAPRAGSEDPGWGDTSSDAFTIAPTERIGQAAGTVGNVTAAFVRWATRWLRARGGRD